MRHHRPLLPQQPLLLRVFGLRIRIEGFDAALRDLVHAVFEAMAGDDDGGPVDLCYRIERKDARQATVGAEPDEVIRTIRLTVARDCATSSAPTRERVLLQLQAELTVDFQKKRPDLLFLHAAAVDIGGKAVLLAAQSGGGKSTTTLALLHRRFGYLSDELSPVDLGSMLVHPYPRAVALKRRFRLAVALPQDAIELEHTIHVPARSLAGAVVTDERPIRAIFFVEHRPELDAPALRPLGRAAAAARLYANALNVLAHPNRGLDATIRIAKQVPCYAVSSAGLAATCALIERTATVSDRARRVA